MRRPTQFLATLVALAASACAGELGEPGPDDDDDDAPAAVCPATRSYAGFGGAALEANRPAIKVSADRLRVKPFGVLSAEYARTLGLASFNTNAYASTFGQPPARWFAEPAASASTMYAAFALAFEACSTHTMTGDAYAAAPTATSADTVCRDLAHRAWTREATADEVAACVTYATTKTNPSHEPRRRWAYTCAAVLSASGFLAY